MILGSYHCQSAEETHRLGKALGERLKPNTVIAFFGDLGAGKTTFIRGLTQGIGDIDVGVVSSPTFTFLNIYNGKQAIYHFDLYRLPRHEEFIAAGFEEYLSAGGVCCIEWAEKIEPLLPQETVFVRLSYKQENSRAVEISQRLS